MKILSVSDNKVPFIYSPQIKNNFGDVAFVIACGDLPYYYQDYIISTLDVPLFFVHGNHDPKVEYSDHCAVSAPRGGINLHGRHERHNDILLAGVEGSIRYKREGDFQYTQTQMFFHILRLIPGLLYNRIVYGRFLDIFVTHAPPHGIHDKDDRPHVGIKAFLWFIKLFQPKYHFHGHTHVYRPDEIRETMVGKTKVLNTYEYLETELNLN